MSDKKQQWEATGRRKSAAARVRLSPGSGRLLINGREGAEFLRRDVLEMVVRQPLALTDNQTTFDITCSVKGGGLTGVAGAIRHGISRALLEYDAEYRTPLKRAGYLTRDARIKERKKYGLKGARARYQFSKR